MQLLSILSYAIVYGGLQRRPFTMLSFTEAYEAIFPALFEYACIYCHIQLCYMMSCLVQDVRILRECLISAYAI